MQNQEAIQKLALQKMTHGREMNCKGQMQFILFVLLTSDKDKSNGKLNVQYDIIYEANRMYFYP